MCIMFVCGCVDGEYMYSEQICDSKKAIIM